MKKENIR